MHIIFLFCIVFVLVFSATGQDDHDHEEEHYFDLLLSTTGSTLSEKMSLSALNQTLNQLNEQCLKAETIFNKLQVSTTDGLTEDQFLRASLVIALYLRGNHNLPCDNQLAESLFNTAQTELFGMGQVCKGNITTLVDTIRDMGAPQPNDTVTNCFGAVQLLSSCSSNTTTVSEAVTGMLLYLYQRRCILPEPSFFINNIFEFMNSSTGNIASSANFQTLLQRFTIGAATTTTTTVDDHNHARRRRSVDDDYHMTMRRNAHDHDHMRMRRSSHDHDDHEHADESKCFTATELLIIAGDQHDSSENLILSGTGLVEICPAILQQFVRGVCSSTTTTTSTSTSSYTTAQKYGYGTISVLIISLLAFCGLLLFPSIGSHFYKAIMQFLIALGVGTLSGDALLHLIPEILGLHSHSSGDSHNHEQEDRSYIYKLLVVIGGLYLFYLFENGFRVFNNIRQKSLVRQFPVNGTNQIETSQMPSDVEAKEKKIAEAEGSTEDKPVCCGIPPVGLMILAGDIFHNLGDGLALGVAFGTSATAGLATSIAIFCHELPHEFGDFALYLSKGMTKVQALLFNFLAACWAFIGLYIGLSISANSEARQWLLAVVVGMFLYISLVTVFHELMHQITQDHALKFFILQNIGLLLGWTILLLLALFEDRIESSLSS